MPEEIRVNLVPECKFASITTVERTFFHRGRTFRRKDMNLKYKICSWLCGYYFAANYTVDKEH
jgi:hypothetical protein